MKIFFLLYVYVLTMFMIASLQLFFLLMFVNCLKFQNIQIWVWLTILFLFKNFKANIEPWV